ncbi:hypothetical protein HQO24_11655 [Rhodococcus fascians]|nr:hypothetical protein [Rhodococcus fascians]MBY4382102.1 hypothetical protein [Rhodococcus fascians]MBY4396971.1 hypothetical protein [Rhodococcus fascians]MBY4405791.1 hypothetical protein [Rhodococcus fascians]MBY4421729.1 hypothetical protein [Rhodococcus fascians]MBY4461001.1 hypothetical protein [Rhodococcus fascians]
MAHILDRTNSRGPVTGWIEVIAKAAALEQISDTDPTDTHGSQERTR